MHIGIIGYGTVGKSIHNMLDKHSILINDPAKGYLGESMLDTDACFVCVPTPTIDDGQDISIVREVLSLLYENLYPGLIIIKSTTTPKNIAKLISEYGNLSIMLGS
jgi:UDP-glucose 6-dehydrogenase